MGFDGFPRAGLAFLTTLGGHDREWFQANRATYDADVAAPAKEFVEAMTSALQESIGAEIVGQPKVNGSISPINNDLRFARDAAPYKDHLLFRWWEGPVKKTAPTLFVRLSESDTGFATGMAFPSVDDWRRAVDGGSGTELVEALVELGEGCDLDVAGQALKRVPAPYEAGHPRADLLRHKGFQARWAEPTPGAVDSAEFVPWCVQRLERCADIHRWLVAHLATPRR